MPTVPFENRPLPYAYNALEPYIDTETLQLHHTLHLQAYIDRLNQALLCLPGLHNRGAAQLAVLQNRPTVSKNAGGVFNHRFYFAGMTPNPTHRISTGALQEAIAKHFCSQENFVKAFTAAALYVFGSGYAWLTCDRRKQLMIVTTMNQEVPMLRGLRPLLCCDVWEHAYYLRHRDRRAEYIENWFQVIDWQRADALFTGTVPFFEDV